MTRDEIKEAAIRLVESDGLINLSRSGLCEAVGIPAGSFPHVMGCNFSEFVKELQRDGVSSPNHLVNKSRTDPELRRSSILESAVAVALNTDSGYIGLTSKEVAAAAGVSKSLIARYFPKMSDLREAVMSQAIRHELPEIIAQGLVAKDPQVRDLPAELRAKAAQMLIAS